MVQKTTIINELVLMYRGTSYVRGNAYKERQKKDGERTHKSKKKEKQQKYQRKSREKKKSRSIREQIQMRIVKNAVELLRQARW